MNNLSDNNIKTMESVDMQNTNNNMGCLGKEQLPIDKLMDAYEETALKQKKRLLEIWKNGETISLIIEKAATDDHPVAELKSNEFYNWRFRLSRRLCVKGFLHKQKVGAQLELYIDNFSEDQIVFVSYIKKDQLAKDKRNTIVSELRAKLHEDKDINNQIENILKEEPLEVKIDTVLDDHIIVDYDGLYGTMTASDLFHSKSKEDMKHYKQLQKEGDTMKVYVNTVDSTGNVSFSETRMTELCNNPEYKKKEIEQPKWINDINHFEGLTVGQEIECIIWNYSNSGLFVLFNNNGYVQSLIPNTALTEQDICQWAEKHPLNSKTFFRIVKIDKEQKRITLFPKDVTTPKYPQQVSLEETTTAQVNVADIKEGQYVDIEVICESKVDQDILYVKCGKYRGLTNVKEDMPDCLRHESGRHENGYVKRTFISNLITRNNSGKPTIKLPAIAHIKNNTYIFSVLDACSRCIEQLDEKELCPNYREVAIVLSWQNIISNERYAIVRWHNLYSFIHLDAKEIQDLNYEGDWESGSKLTLWINGIDQDLSFDAEPTDPRTNWKSLNIQAGDFVFINKIWLSRMGIYRTKIDGCKGTILPGFKLDEEQIDYQLKVILIDKEKQILILSDGSHQLLSLSDIEEDVEDDKGNETKDGKNDREIKRSTHLIMPLDKNLFLAEDHKTKKRVIIQTTPPAYAFLCAIYRHFNIDKFIRLNEEEELHFKYRDFFFSCYFNKYNNNFCLEWKGSVMYTGFSASFSHVLEKKGFTKVSWNYGDLPYDFTCNDIVRCKIIEGERHNIQNWALNMIAKPKVYFTGKILYSNNEIYPLFSFEDPNVTPSIVTHIQTKPRTIDCQIILYDEGTNTYMVEFETQRGLLKCREKKELRFFPNEIVKGIFKGDIDPITQMPCLSLFELKPKKLVINNTYEADLIGRRMEGIVLYIRSSCKRIFIPNKILYATKQEYDKEPPLTMMVKYKGIVNGKEIFELDKPHTIVNKPPKDYKCKITIFSKNEKDYDAYIIGGQYDGLTGYLPARYVDYKSSEFTIDQQLMQGDTKDAIIIENKETDDIVFSTQSQTKYSLQFRKGLRKKGIIISEEQDKYIISFDSIYGYSDKNYKLSVGRSYDFSISEYVLASRGPQLSLNGKKVAYRVILKVNPVLRTNKKNQLLAHISGYDDEKIYLEAGIYNLYAKLNNEEITELFINCFGKIELLSGTEVYVEAKEIDNDMLHDGVEVRIIKRKE